MSEYVIKLKSRKLGVVEDVAVVTDRDGERLLVLDKDNHTLLALSFGIDGEFYLEAYTNDDYRILERIRRGIGWIGGRYLVREKE